MLAYASITKKKDKKDNRRLPGIREINLTADQVQQTGENGHCQPVWLSLRRRQRTPREHRRMSNFVSTMRRV